MDYRIFPPDEIIDTTIHLPLSKSESARALIINALTPGATPLERIAECDDTAAMLRGLAVNEGTIDIGAAGTAMRFLTAYHAAHQGSDVIIDGCERMRERPISQLVDALRQCGADITYTGREGFPPLAIKGRRLKGGTVQINPTVSSQFISALLMVAPSMESPLVLSLDGEPASLPYILMTIAMMERAGAEVSRTPGLIEVQPKPYVPCAFTIEEDWSAAAFWYEVAAIGSAYIALPGLKLHSHQGDAACVNIFERLGAVTDEEDGVLSAMPTPDLFGRLDIDMSDTPDLAQAAIVTCAAVSIPFHITGLASLRIKETDRLEALHKELLKIGVDMEITANSAQWDGKRLPVFEMPAIDTYGDHRMAMSFAPLALLIPGLIVRDVEVVSKSYPTFWDDMRHAGFIITDASLPLEGDDDGTDEGINPLYGDQQSGTNPLATF